MTSPHKVKIEWSCDMDDWDLVEGAKAWVDDECVFDNPAILGVSRNVTESEVYNVILNHIGYDVESWVEGEDNE